MRFEKLELTKNDDSGDPSSGFFSDCGAAMHVHTSIKSVCGSLFIFFELALKFCSFIRERKNNKLY